jgi:hypothetical protein
LKLCGKRSSTSHWAIVLSINARHAASIFHACWNSAAARRIEAVLYSRGRDPKRAPIMRWCTLSSRINLGNLGYALTARNFNPVIAMAADTVIACVDTSSRSVSLRPTTS